MGTNYYVHYNICECCERHDVMHVGKSSYGWAFALRVATPEIMAKEWEKEEQKDLPKNFEEWCELFKREDIEIWDEYSREITAEKMIDIITNRKNIKHCDPDGSHCLSNGKGTWDHMVGEYS